MLYRSEFFLQKPFSERDCKGNIFFSNDIMSGNLFFTNKYYEPAFYLCAYMQMKNIHFIAVGGAAMHNLALDLAAAGLKVTGSDDEIYEPALSNLRKAGLLPDKTGWFPERITEDLDAVILGMHARSNNPELLRAAELGLRIFSYPEFVYLRSEEKKRVVIAGSHGKTTTTAMVMHVLQKTGIDADYLLGAKIEGFERMVKISDAPLIIIEGDEYLSSPIDRKPKIHHYKPHITVLTGIAWDHINVFPTFENYVSQFEIYLGTIEKGGVLIYNKDDNSIEQILSDVRKDIRLVPYSSLDRQGKNSIIYNKRIQDVSVIGKHNLSNMSAAKEVCAQLGISDEDFFNYIADFKGASKRLQIINQSEHRTVFLDFAHAPSKVTATCTAVKEWYGEQKLLAVLELHTFSSLNKDFIPQYKDSLASADKAVIFFNAHTLEMKKMPELNETFLVNAFGHADCIVLKSEQQLLEYLSSENFNDYNILLMSSGNFNQMNLSTLR
jgi:UDP-N-acetylmuramate: L-alanyl-gamma-D-glutamyl-meso-diaminopimelate ligase